MGITIGPWIKASYGLKQILKGIALATLAYHAASQIDFLNARYKYEQNKPQIVKEFEEKTGIRIYDHNNTPITSMEILIETLEREKVTKKEVSEVTIESKNYHDKSLTGKILSLNGIIGLYNVALKDITLTSVDEKLATHEIAHAKTFGHEKYGQLCKEWEKISKDCDGKTYYMNDLEMILSYTFLKKFVDNDANPGSKGFVSKYSRVNVFEDIAEFVEEESYKINNNSTTITSISNPMLKRKLYLAVKYGFLPKESMQAYELQSKFDKIHQKYLSSNRKEDEDGKSKAIEEFFAESDRFIADNPNSVFVLPLRLDRAKIMHASFSVAKTYDPKDQIQIILTDANIMNSYERLFYTGILTENNK